MKLEKLITPEAIKQFLKYVFTGGLSYIFVFAGLIFLVEYIKFSSTLSFAIIYAINYVVMYFVHLKYIFSKDHSRRTLLRFTLHIFVFYLVNNLMYYFLDQILDLNYILSLVLNIGLLFPLRFLSIKLFVFRG